MGSSVQHRVTNLFYKVSITARFYSTCKYKQQGTKYCFPMTWQMDKFHLKACCLSEHSLAKSKAATMMRLELPQTGKCVVILLVNKQNDLSGGQQYFGSGSECLRMTTNRNTEQLRNENTSTYTLTHTHYIYTTTDTEIAHQNIQCGEIYIWTGKVRVIVFLYPSKWFWSQDNDLSKVYTTVSESDSRNQSNCRNLMMEQIVKLMRKAIIKRIMWKAVNKSIGAELKITFVASDLKLYNPYIFWLSIWQIIYYSS